ncbi:MAG: OmpA family protein [Sedimentisphaerales bacterium]|nr:OmpA family protein [Sedimentisphaerales bacterium]
MKPARRALLDDKAKVPAYIVTFSDMVTLLLTFFVLLLTLAEVQDPELFNRGRDSFWESIRLHGLGALLGTDMSVDLGSPTVKHPTTEPDSSVDRTLDEYREQLRRIFERIEASMTTLPAQIVGQRLDFSVTDVRFTSGQAVLDEAAQRFLSRYCLDLQQSLDPQTSTLYVLGLAGEETTEAEQWMLSAQRAEAVARFLQDRLAQDVSGRLADRAPPWRVLWWGAGPGGHWAGQDRPDPRTSQILIAVLKWAG